jgi:SNF2 family DNA or RNA helicase
MLLAYFAWLKKLTYHRHVCTSSLRVMKYHGSTRAKDGHSFSDYDLVLSTYGTVSREFASGNSQLYEAQWFRLVLDEGEQLNSDLTVGLLTNPSRQPIIFVTKVPDSSEQCLRCPQNSGGV